MPFCLLSHEDWEVSLVINDQGDWFLQFNGPREVFTWKIDRESPEGIHFHNWIGDNYPDVISEAMNFVWR
jgi:hypothetical protein